MEEAAIEKRSMVPHGLTRWALAAPLLTLLSPLVLAAEQPFADVRLPTKNYLRNGGFEHGEDGWEYFADRRFGGVTQDEKRSGTACFEASGVIDGYRYFQQNSVPLIPGRSYTLSAWLKCSGFPRATGNSQVVNLANYGWTESASLGPAKPDQEWTKHSVTFVAPPTREVSGQPGYTLIVFWPVKSAGTVWIDDIQIEEGDQSTEFTECYLGWAFETLSALRTVHQRATQAGKSLTDNFAAFPIAVTLGEKAAGILKQAEVLGEQLKSYAELAPDEARALLDKAEGLKGETASLRSLHFLGNPYLPLSEVALPEVAPDELTVKWTCFVDEQRALALNVANFTNDSSTSRLVPGNLLEVGRQARVIGHRWVTAYSVPEIRGHVKPTSLYTDPLPKCDEAGQFFVANGKVSQAVLLVDTSALLPGDYTGTIDIASLTDESDRRSLTVDLTVLPVRLCKITDVDISDVGTMDSYALDSIGPLGINCFSLPAQWFVPSSDPTGKGNMEVDFARIAPLVQARLQRCPEARFFLCFGAGAAITKHFEKTYGLSLEDERFRTFATNWVKAVVKGFAELGVGPERIIIETVDEPGHGQFAEAVTWAEIIGAAEPKVRTQTYVTSFDPDNENAAKVYESHDIIAPGFTWINEESVDYLKQRGKEVWVYDCQNNAETFHPLSYYRLLPWLAKKHDLDGWGHFSELASERGRNYVPWEGVAEQSLVYPSVSGGQVISRRWLALAAGVQDYRALCTLERLVEAAEKRADEGDRPTTEIVAKAVALLADLPTKVRNLLKPGKEYFTGLAPNAEAGILDEFREEIAAAATGLAAAIQPETTDLKASLRHANGTAVIGLDLPERSQVTARYLCDRQLPWRTTSAHLPAGQSELPLPTENQQTISRCLVEVTDAAGLVTATSPLPLVTSVEVDSTIPPYEANRLNDGLAMPGMKFEPEQGWISGGAATDHWVVVSLGKPTRVTGIRLWWMTFYGLPQAYKVEAWVDGQWQSVLPVGDWRAAAAAVEKISLKAAVTDRLRVTQKAAGGNRAFPNLMGLSEIEVY